MIKHVDVIYDEKPKDIIFSKEVVFVVKTCEEVQLKDEIIGATFTKYKCDVEEYKISEYIDILAKKNNSLSSQVDDAQVALTELFEMILNMLS